MVLSTRSTTASESSGGCVTSEETTYAYTGRGPPALECPICRDPLSDPVQTACDHLFCRACLSRALDLVPTCPIDRTPLPDGIAGCRQAPRAINALLDDIRVRCGGCEEEVLRGNWAGHRKGCRARMDGEEDCWIATASSAKVDRRVYLTVEGKTDALETAGRSESEEFSRREHEPTSCSYCTSSLPPVQLASHILTCPSIPTPCPYAKFGCSARYPRSELRPLHLASGECVYEPFKEGLARANEMWEGLEEENWVLRRKVQKLEDVVQLLHQDTGAFKTSLGRFIQLPSSSDTSQPASDPRTPPPPSLPETLDALTSTAVAQKDAISALSTSQTAQQATNQHLSEEVSALRHAVGGMRGMMSGMLGEIQRLSFAASRPDAGEQQPSRRPGFAPSMQAGGSDSGGEGDVEVESSGSDEEGHLPPGLQPSLSSDYRYLRLFLSTTQPFPLPPYPFPFSYPHDSRPVFSHPPNGYPPPSDAYDPSCGGWTSAGGRLGTLRASGRGGVKL